MLLVEPKAKETQNKGINRAIRSGPSVTLGNALKINDEQLNLNYCVEFNNHTHNHKHWSKYIIADILLSRKYFLFSPFLVMIFRSYPELCVCALLWMFVFVIV